MTDILVFGAGGHARVVADVVRLSGEYRLHGFIDQGNQDRYGTAFEGSRVLGGDDIVAGLMEDGITHAAVAIGDNAARVRIGEALALGGFQLPVLVHPAAVIAASVDIGKNTVVFAGAIVNPATRIGAHVIINTGACIDHDCVIGSGVHIAPGVHIAGGVTIGEGSLVGVGASIRPGVSIGRNVTIGVGAAVVGDVRDGVTVMGVPARVLE